MIVFFGWLCSSIAVVPHIEIGLDQELSMPEDSYVLKYFQVCRQPNLSSAFIRMQIVKHQNYLRFTLSVLKQLPIDRAADVFCR